MHNRYWLIVNIPIECYSVTVSTQASKNTTINPMNKRMITTIDHAFPLEVAAITIPITRKTVAIKYRAIVRAARKRKRARS